ncbi:MAG: UbiA-like polyprenyltransferase [Tenuifilaceae bacterium]
MGKEKFKVFKNYLSLVKFSHTVFAMPFALIGFFLAIGYYNYEFSWKLLLLVLLCMVTARNSAMSFNRVTDRFIDKRNPRTAGREIPSGKIQPRNALVFSIINAVIFIIATFHINRLVFYLSPVALLIILGYSYTKRYTVLCHLVLGLGLSLAPIGAFLSVTGRWDIVPMLFSAIVILWVSGFDILYSIQDEDFDKDENLKSIPAVLGRGKALGIAITLHALVVLVVIKAGVLIGSGLLYWIGAALFTALLIYQHYVVISSNYRRINFAFATLNGLSSILFAIFVILNNYFFC